MNLADVKQIFNRAWAFTFCKKKWLLVFTVLTLCGLLFVFFRGLGIATGGWTLMSLTFLPLFLSAGVLLSVGIILIRIYHDEIKQKPIQYRNVLYKSWETVIGVSYFSIPIILSYLLLWMLLAIFVLLRQIPGIGDFFAVILAFGPFLLNLAVLTLFVLNFSLLFFVTPIVALRGLNHLAVAQTLAQRFEKDAFSNLFLAAIALIPLAFSMGILFLAAFLTGSTCYTCELPLQNVLQWFFIMIPFAALLAPAVIFFFNFAAESHVLLQQNN